MIRTFVAVPVVETSKLAGLRNELKRSLPVERIRWVDPSQLHVTLYFLGNTEPSVANRIADRMRRSFRGVKPERIQLQGLGTFGRKEKPSVLWAGMADDAILISLHDQVINIFRELDIACSPGNFTPHLTIARIRNASDPEKIERILSMHATTRLGYVDIKSVVYYESKLSDKGPAYSIIEKSSIG
ncbi:MAG: RNA 2',3'-cyclic phosphodiesterase [Bacteroidales bacterium]|nr:RNA 2',3'-cyclic phosphodiesterase [Bacteroidales bacterium]